MGKNDFNRHQCIRALEKLGFVKKNVRHGKHDKYTPTDYLLQKRQSGQPSFIMVPRSRNLHCQLEILKELWAFGGDELVNKFLSHI